MNDNTDLPHQPDTYHQDSPLIKKKSNISWVGFSILLIILHIQFGWGVANITSIRTLNILMMSPFFLALAVVDYSPFAL
jgi:hypothetical protein